MPLVYRKYGGAPTPPPPASPTGCRRMSLNEYFRARWLFITHLKVKGIPAYPLESRDLSFY